jgi:cyclopropane fatty-acyl-phospholipid synthase-like methyltransferase
MSEWMNFFDTMPDQRVFGVEAEEFVARLGQVVPLRPPMRVLDFGSGFGYVAAGLAQRVGDVTLWDGSPRLRALSAAKLADVQNTRVLDQEPWSEGRRFDLIVVNSVIQYVTVAQFREWLIGWKALLSGEGCLVVADILPKQFQGHRDVLDQLAFAWRQRFFFRAVRDGLQQIGGYGKTRQARPLTRYSQEDLEQLAEETGLRAEFLSRNLTCRTARISVIFRDAGSFRSPST